VTAAARALIVMALLMAGPTEPSVRAQSAAAGVLVIDLGSPLAPTAMPLLMRLVDDAEVRGLRLLRLSADSLTPMATDQMRHEVANFTTEAARTYGTITMGASEAAEIVRGNEARRDEVITRECKSRPRAECGGAVHAAALAAIADIQDSTERRLRIFASSDVWVSKPKALILATGGYPSSTVPAVVGELARTIATTGIPLTVLRVPHTTAYGGVLNDVAERIGPRSQGVVDVTNAGDIATALGPLPMAPRAGADAPPSITRRPSADDVLVAAVKSYARHFVEELTFAIAHEHYQQEVRSRAGSFGRTAGLVTARRTTESEVRLAHVAEGMWLMARDVRRVDGVSLEAASVTPTSNDNPVSEPEILARMREAIATNAKWNIGGTTRNVNIPTLAIWFLTSPISDRFRFTAAGTGRSSHGASCRRLKFEERSRPVLINADRGGAPATGTICVLPESGAIVGTQLLLQQSDTAQSRWSVREPASHATIDVAYVYEPNLGLWVPETMTERYEQPNERDSDVITAKAAYSDYRRFVVTAVVK